MNAPAHDLALVLVTHNSATWIETFAHSWQTASAATPLSCELLVVDAGSTDDSCAAVTRLLPGARLLRSPNLGYGASLNRAAAASSARWLLLCNPDLTFPRDFFPQFILPALQGRWPARCLVPRLINPDGTLQPSVGRFPTLRGILRDQFRPRPRRKYLPVQPSREGPIDWASAACLLIARSAFDAVGGFDEQYFLYVEEVDLQRRLRACGEPVWCIPQAHVVHHQPNALRPPRAEIQRHAARGLLRYFAKFSPLSLAGYRLLALLSGRLPAREALAPRTSILAEPEKTH